MNDFLTSIEMFENKILEGEVGYLPNPALTKIKCDFRHKHCKQSPEYTDGQNHYCWMHSIMIQDKQFK